MSEVIEQAVTNQRILEAEVASPLPTGALPDLLRVRPPGGSRRCVPARWNSSLCESDLQCLLQVLEAELIPRLISGYSPARCSPQDSRMPKE